MDTRSALGCSFSMSELDSVGTLTNSGTQVNRQLAGGNQKFPGGVLIWGSFISHQRRRVNGLFWHCR